MINKKLKNVIKKITPKKKIKSSNKVNNKLRFVNESNIKKLSILNQKEMLDQMNLDFFGLDEESYEARLEKYGTNEINKKGFA
jgi:hypothetical protein